MTIQRKVVKEIDPLTGLQRNIAFLEMIRNMIENKQQCEIMIIGIDNFKTINNLYTYSFGNLILQYFANELQEVLPSSTTLFRLDGDNFGVIYYGELHQQCETIYKEVSQQSTYIEGIHITFTVSAGICQCSTFGEDENTMYANVYLALDYAKSGTKNCYRYYTPEISEQIKEDMLLLERLRISTTNEFQGFELYYQPIMRGDSKTLYGCEALLRFKDEIFNEGVSPYRFIPLLEQSGLILPVGKWVIAEAIEQCAKWQKLVPDFCMNINIAASQLDDHDFSEYILRTISHHNVASHSIILELTESEQADFEKIRRFFDTMRKQGFQTALDDFGTGYASLDIFRQVSADELKIDRSFLYCQALNY